VSVVLTWSTQRSLFFVPTVIIQSVQKNIGIGYIKIAGTNNIASINRPGPDPNDEQYWI
jgi:hypothetical protein